jgi:predicted RNase H-like HicB family nuclease
MSPHFTDAPGPIHHYLFVRPDSSGKYTGGVFGLPEVRVSADTEAEAFRAIKEALLQWLATTRWVQLRVPEPATAHPATEFAGHAKDDPDFDEYLEQIRRYRQEADERECSSTSSTPTT